MAQAARWMRMRVAAEGEVPETCARLAAAQPSAAGPLLAWLSTPHGWAFALIAPRRFAPGRARRWLAWGAMPAIATCRRFGLPAYLEDEAIWLHGRRAAALRAAPMGECAVIEGAFPARLATEPQLEPVFRERIEAQHGWCFDTAWPSGGEVRR